MSVSVCLCSPQPPEPSTARHLQQGLCLHQRGAQGLDQATTWENVLSSPSPFGRCWTLHVDDTLTGPRPNGIVLDHAACELFHWRCESYNPALSTCSTTHARGSEASTANRASPTQQPRDLPVVGSHCDARPAFAASEICLINVTPILCPLIPFRLSLGCPRERPPGPFSSTCSR